MKEERYRELMDVYATPTAGVPKKRLTPEEFSEGWHFCAEWDGLLVGPGMEELHACSCFSEDHPVYKTKPPMPEMFIVRADGTEPQEL